MSPTDLVIGPLGVVFSWLPEKLSLLDGMTLGAGFGAAIGGGIGLFLKTVLNQQDIELENLIVAGTIGGLVLGAAGVAAGVLVNLG
jgi:hypothetical protein